MGENMISKFIFSYWSCNSSKQNITSPSIPYPSNRFIWRRQSGPCWYQTWYSKIAWIIINWIHWRFAMSPIGCGFLSTWYIQQTNRPKCYDGTRQTNWKFWKGKRYQILVNTRKLDSMYSNETTKTNSRFLKSEKITASNFDRIIFYVFYI